MSSKTDALKGTTWRVYRYTLRSKEPVGVREVQRALNLSNSSVAQYHLNKLEEMNLIKQETRGYVVDKVVLHNVIRFRRMLIPKQISFLIFFITTSVFQIIIFRPTLMTPSYIFALTVNLAAVIIFLYETVQGFMTTEKD